MANVPTKREQNGACSGSAEHSALRSQGNVPTLRFPGFTEEWLQLPLNNVLEKLENGTTYNPNENTGLPMSRIETIAKGVIDYNRVGYCSEVKRLERYRMIKGDILFSHINSVKHIGKSAYYEEEQPLYHGMNLLLMRTNSATDSKFLFYLINNSCFLRRCQILAKQAVNQASLSTSDLKGIEINMPSKSEQKKIAGFISLLDERIALQSNLIDRLKSLMDGIIDKMTARTPNIFIENCLDCYSSTLQEGETEKQGTYPVYGANGVCGYLDYATISAPAILIVKDGSGVGNVSYTNGDCSVVGTLNY